MLVLLLRLLIVTRNCAPNKPAVLRVIPLCFCISLKQHNGHFFFKSSCQKTVWKILPNKPCVIFWTWYDYYYPPWLSYFCARTIRNCTAVLVLLFLRSLVSSSSGRIVWYEYTLKTERYLWSEGLCHRIWALWERLWNPKDKAKADIFKIVRFASLYNREKKKKKKKKKKNALIKNNA